MKQHIIFFDIDGTLVDQNGIIPKSTKEALEQLKQNGHLVFINTGRVRSEIEDNILELQPDGYICGCGIYIEYKDNILLHHQLSHDMSREIAKDMEEYQLDGVLEGTEHIYFRKESRIPYVEKVKKRFLRELKDAVRYWDDSEICFNKMAIGYGAEEIGSQQMEAFKEKHQKDFDFIRREINFYEAVPSGYSKATGIQYIMNYCNCSLDRVVAVGDSTNDLSMLTFVKKSIAMGNSDSSLFPIVDFVTKDLMEDGIYHGLKHYGLI